MKKSKAVILTFVSFILLSFLACKNASDQTELNNDLTIRIANEPDNLNPIFSRSLYATPIENLILLPLAEYDPFTLELSPLLVKDLAVIEKVTEGPYKGGKRYKYEMREEAVWSDGTPVSALDYEFTLKIVFNPFSPTFCISTLCSLCALW